MKWDWFFNNKSTICLVLGFVFSVFSLGRFNIAIFIFFWPWMNLYYLHHHPKKCVPLILILVSCLVSNMLKWIGNTNINIGLDLIAGMYWGIVPYLPFLVDKLLYDKIDKWRLVILFPLLVSSFEFIFAFLPISNLSIYGNAFVYDLVLIQTCAAFGIYFLSFIIAFFSSLLEYTIEIYEESKKFSKYILIYLLCLFAFVLYGAIRMLVPIDRENIKMVSVLGPSPQDYDQGDESFHDLEEFYSYIENALNKSAAIDAKLLAFCEDGFYLYETNLTEFLDKSCLLFAKYKMYGVLTYDVERSDGSYSNSLSIIDNKGKILYNYTKHHTIPIVEAEYKRGTDSIKVIETELGKLTAVICYDLNYPFYMNYIGLYHPDIVIAPSWDYPGVYRYQSENARLRAVENGFNLLKLTADGATVASDYMGERHFYSIAWTGEDFFFVSEVPKKGAPTLYSYIGVGFNFLYIIAVFLVIFIKRKKTVDIKEINLVEELGEIGK